MTYSVPTVVQVSDFLMTFYVAGRMVVEGKASQLYPDPAATSLVSTFFNSYTHQVLDQLPQGKVAVYMYPPLTAFLFQPLGLLTPPIALMVWQGLSVIAYAISVHLIAVLKHKDARKYFLISILFFPILQTLLLGHLAIVLGLLPLSLGYWLLMKERPFLSGLAFATLLLKPQFLPVGLLIATALVLNRHFKFCIAFVLGLLALVLTTIMSLGPDVSYRWILSLKLSDTIFSDPNYGYATYLVSSLPGAVLQILPFSLRSSAKLVLYPLALVIGCHALFLAWRLIKKAGDDYLTAIPFVILLGIFVLPLVLPHFLLYDLSILAIGAVIIYSNEWTKIDRRLHRDLLLAWIFLDVYIPIAALAFVKMHALLPFVLLAGLVVLYVRILALCRAYGPNSAALPG